MKRLAIVCLTAAVLAGCAMGGKHGEKDEEMGEVKMAMKDCPAAVQATFRREAGGVEIAQVDKGMEKGRTVYEADAVMGGSNYSIEVAEDGTLLQKKLDMEDEKQDEKGEKKQ